MRDVHFGALWRVLRLHLLRQILLLVLLRLVLLLHHLLHQVLAADAHLLGWRTFPVCNERQEHENKHEQRYEDRPRRVGIAKRRR